jgi:hypothetical protein
VSIVRPRGEPWRSLASSSGNGSSHSAARRKAPADDPVFREAELQINRTVY